MTLSFRPHHFLCTLGFQGKGYSPSFVENYTHIANSLHAHEDLSLKVVFRTDSICAPCPHQRGKGCVKERKIQDLDRRHSLILNLKPGDVLTWAEAKERLREHMTLDAFHSACAGCQWKPLGLCEMALRKLRGEEVYEEEALP